jgi:hypothetical protein
VTWQAGQHQPHALAALVVAHDVLVHAAGQRWHIAVPDLTARIEDRPARGGVGYSGRVAPVTSILEYPRGWIVGLPKIVAEGYDNSRRSDCR